MNTVVLTTITVTVALVYGYNPHPCQKNDDNNAYNKFVRKHILQRSFDRSSKPEWKRYLNETGLCNRPRQTFMEQGVLTRVEDICNGYGRQLYPNHSNLCISNSFLSAYHVSVGWGCKVEQVKPDAHYVIVACDRIGNQCLPVHYEPYYDEFPDPNAPLCTP